MFCTKCGAQNTEGSGQCAKCGEKLFGPLPLPTTPLLPTPLPQPTQATSIIRGPQTLQARSSQRYEPQTCGLAVASLIVGLLSGILFFLAPVGIILGLVALRKISRNKGMLGGEGLAMAGLVTSIFLSVISAILMAVLIPVFVSARESSRSHSCLNNLKQQSEALMCYANDYDDHYPKNDHWEDALEIYVRSPGAFVCPDLPDAPSGYTWNAQLNMVKIEKVEYPARTVSIFDSAGGWNGCGGIELMAPRHAGRLNVVFADGHSVSKSPDTLRDTRWWCIRVKSGAGAVR